MYKDKEEQKKWNKKNIVAYRLTFNVNNDKDVLKHFNKQHNKRDYLIGLIRKDMR